VWEVHCWVVLGRSPVVPLFAAFRRIGACVKSWGFEDFPWTAALSLFPFLVVERNVASNARVGLFPFPFSRVSRSLFPCESTVISNEFQ